MKLSDKISVKGISPISISKRFRPAFYAFCFAVQFEYSACGSCRRIEISPS